MRIAVFASYSRDTITNGDRTVVVDGGPARYLASALDRVGVAYDVHAGSPPADVRVRVVDGEERGSVARVAPIPVPSDCAADASIVSTILDEFSLDALARLPGIVALDVQGFVRRPDGMRGPLAIDAACWPSIDIVKTTEGECDHASVEFLAFARSRTLLVTRGMHGAAIWNRGVAHEIPAVPVPVLHTLGMGDTFLAAFVAATLRGMDAGNAGQFASRVVHDVLTERNAHSLE